MVLAAATGEAGHDAVAERAVGGEDGGGVRGGEERDGGERDAGGRAEEAGGGHAGRSFVRGVVTRTVGGGRGVGVTRGAPSRGPRRTRRRGQSEEDARRSCGVPLHLDRGGPGGADSRRKTLGGHAWRPLPQRAKAPARHACRPFPCAPCGTWPVWCSWGRSSRSRCWPIACIRSGAPSVVATAVPTAPAQTAQARAVVVARRKAAGRTVLRGRVRRRGWCRCGRRGRFRRPGRGVDCEQGVGRFPLEQAAWAVDQLGQDVLELGRVADPRGDARLVQGGGVGEAVAGYAAVARDGQARGEGLQGGQAARVLDQDVGGVHQAGHVVDPAVDVLDAVRAELLGECVVAAADHERYGRTAVAQVPGDLTDRSDAPGTRNQQGQ